MVLRELGNQKGTKDMQVLGLEDKRQITMVVSSNVAMDLLPPQIVFTSSITFKSFPPNNQGKKIYIKDGWDLTFSENRWSSLEITKKFVTNILFPYMKSYIQILGLDKEQKVVWIKD